MNWYDTLLNGEGDIQRSENHVEVKRFLNILNVDENHMYSMLTKDFPKNLRKIGHCFWLKMTPVSESILTKFRYLEILHFDNEMITFRHPMISEFPTVITIGKETLVASWSDVSRIGPTDVYWSSSHDPTTAVECFFSICYQDTNAEIRIDGIKPSKYIDPFESEFCKDNITKMRLASLLTNNRKLSLLEVRRMLKEMLNELV